MAEEPTAVWSRPERGERGPAPGRSRSQITAAAIELADEGGLAAVSMRQVAKRLGTGPVSLYRYVTTRDELLALMADAAAGEIDLGDPLSGDPIEDLLTLAKRAKQAHLRYAWLLDLPTEPTVGPGAWTTSSRRCARWHPPRCPNRPGWRPSDCSTGW